MMNKIKKLALIIGLMAFGFMATGSVENLVLDTDNAVHATSGSAGTLFDADVKAGEATKNGTASSEIVKKIHSFANVFAGLVLAISIIMIILGGLRYITAQGDPKAVEQGKMILIYSGIGIIIALSAFALGKFFATFAV
jgi:hypothetical protein